MFGRLANWQRSLAERITIVISGAGTADQLRELVELHGLRNVLVDSDNQLFETYHAAGTPSVIVTTDGRIGSQTHATSALVEALVRHTLAREAAPLDSAADAPQDEHQLPLEVSIWSGESVPT
jgi:hypothetical protein